MYQLGTPAQEYKIVSGFNVHELETSVNALLAEDWRILGEMKIQHNISGSMSPGGSSGQTMYYSGSVGNDPISLSVPSGGGGTTGFISTMFVFFQVMVR